MFITDGSVRTPIHKTDSKEMVMQVNQMIWPIVNNGGKKNKAANNWMTEREAADAAQNWRVLRKHRPTCCDSRTK